MCVRRSMIHTQDELTARRVILLRDVSKNVLPLSVATLRQRMKEAGIPELKLGPRKLAM
jgi:hypothetical protein